jgi:hypothetical protein
MILKLKKELFSLTQIATAIKAYQIIANIEIYNMSDYWECHFTDCKFGEELTTAEFENYLIDLINCKK